jgi:hypothetical protein
MAAMQVLSKEYSDILRMKGSMKSPNEYNKNSNLMAGFTCVFLAHGQTLPRTGFMV